MKKTAYITVIFLSLFIGRLNATYPNGTLKGKVTEVINNRIIAGVFIEVMKTKLTSISDEEGRFTIENVPVGSYNVKISVPGFKGIIKTDVVIHPKRITRLDIELEQETLKLEETVEVSVSYFPKKEKEPNSTFNMSAEEIRRAPGSSGDVSRMLIALPGVTNINDFSSDLIVRGGSPAENGFFIDNIEIPNINHFPSFGSSGGFFSAINPDFLEKVDFYTGAFSSVFGDRLSSIIDMSFREGNRNEYDGMLNADLLQAGGILEGPLGKGKGSFLLSGRTCIVRGLQDIGLIKIDYFDFPQMSDFQAKIVYDFSGRQRLTILNVLGTGDLNAGDEDFDVGLDYTQNTAGVNLRSIWNDRFISETSLAYAFIKNGFNLEFQFEDDEFYWNYTTNNKMTNLRNCNYLEINSRNKFEFGIQFKQEVFDQDWHISQYTDDRGIVIEAEDRITNDFTVTKSALFFSYILSPFNGLNASIGLRGDHSSFSEKLRVSPRLTLSYNLLPKLSLNLGYGIFYQALPSYLFADHPEFKELEDPMAVHYVLGLEYRTGKGTRFTLEFYDKEYINLPIHPDYPKRLLSDRETFSLYYPTDQVVNAGTAYSRGVEFLIQKKLVRKFYGLFSGSYFRCRYKDLEGIERNRIYDNRYTMNFTLGYKPTRKWEFGVRWTIMGGAPYTPIDVEASKREGDGIRDQTRFNMARYPAYNSLNVRLEKRFHFSKTGLIIYLDVLNALNRDNVLGYYWNSDENEIKQIPQMPIFPKLGVEFRF